MRAIIARTFSDRGRIASDSYLARNEGEDAGLTVTTAVHGRAVPYRRDNKGGLLF